MKIGGENIKPLVIFLHIVFWSIWVGGFTIIQSLGTGDYLIWLLYYLITLPIFISHTYLIAYWLVPEYFMKRRYWSFAALVVALLIVFSIIELVVSNELVFKIFDPEKSFAPGYLNPANIIISGIGNHYIILAFIAIKAVKSWQETKIIKDELAQQNLETELEIFKYQLQPKFILSLVNELELTAKLKPDKLPPLIVKVSDFINQLLYKAKAELIPLETEIKLIKDFLAIQEMAVGSRLKTNFIVNGNVPGMLVPPLILFPFLNDSCKIVNKCNETFDCTVIIKVEKKYMLFSFTLWSENNFAISDKNNLELTKKRLYYNYDNKYRIIENEDANFKEISIEIFK